MQLRTLKPVSMKEMLAQVRALPLYTHQSAYLWQMCLSVGNQFCDAVVRAGYLSYEQMFSAACRYCIGASKLGGVIFWQIDHEGRVHDGKVMYYLPDCHRNKDKSAHPTWVSALLAKRNGNPKGTSSHCLFGLHQLTTFNLSTDSKLSTFIACGDSRGREDCLYPERTVSGVYLAGIRRTQRSAAREVPPAAWS